MKEIKWSKGIFFKTFIKLSLMMLLLTLVIHGMIYFFYGENNLSKESENLQVKLDYLEALSKSIAKEEWIKSLEVYAKSEDVNINLTLNNETYRFSSSSLILLDELEEENITIKGDEEYSSLLVRSRSVRIGEEEAFLQVAKSLQEIREAKDLSFSFMPYTVLSALFLSFIASLLVTRNLTKPILEMDKTLSEMLQMTEETRVLVKGEDELAHLSKSINELYISLLQNMKDYKRSHDYMRKMDRERLEFLKRTSHELKTPLTKLSILLENMMLGVGQYQDKETYLKEAFIITEEASSMIKEMLYKLKGHSVSLRKLEPLDLKLAIEEELQYYDLYFSSRGISVETQLQETLIPMDEEDLHFLLSNILSNLAKHSLEGSQVKIVLKEGELSIFNRAKRSLEEALEAISRKDKGHGLEVMEKITEDYGLSSDYDHEGEDLLLRVDLSGLLKKE